MVIMTVCFLPADFVFITSMPPCKRRIRYPYLTADNYSPVYDSTNNGRRILRLVNNGNGSYRDGDVIGGTATGFGWYDNNGQLTIDTGYTITVDSVSEDQKNCTITILTNN